MIIIINFPKTTYCLRNAREDVPILYCHYLLIYCTIVAGRIIELRQFSLPESICAGALSRRGSIAFMQTFKKRFSSFQRNSATRRGGQYDYGGAQRITTARRNSIIVRGVIPRLRSLLVPLSPPGCMRQFWRDHLVMANGASLATPRATPIAHRARHVCDVIHAILRQLYNASRRWKVYYLVD